MILKTDRRRLLFYFFIPFIFIGGFFFTSLSLKQDAMIQFESDALKVKQSFYESLKSIESIGYSLASAILLSENLSQDYFGALAQKLRHTAPEIESISFFPYIEAKDRKVFEERLKNQNLGDSVLVLSENGLSPVTNAPEKDFYLPLFFVDALNKDSSYFGFDLFSDTSRSPAALLAMKTTSAQTSESFLLESGHVAAEFYFPLNTDASNQKGVIGIVVDLTKLLGEERWRKALEIDLVTILKGKEKKLFRSLDDFEKPYLSIGRLSSDLQIEKFGQEIKLTLSRQLYFFRINYLYFIFAFITSFILCFFAYYLIKAYENLEEANAFLEQKVEERTKALALSHKEIKEILENLNDMVITVSKDEKIGRHFSKISSQILQSDQIPGASIKQALFRNLNESDQEVLRHMFVLDNLEFMDDFQWTISQHDLLKSLVIKDKNGKERFLSLKYSCIFSESAEFLKLIIVGSDLSELLALKNKIAEDEQKNAALKYFGEMIDKDSQMLFDFFKEAKSRLDETMKKAILYQKEDLAMIKRQLHTLKGSSRTAGLKFFSSFIHQIENDLESLKSSHEEKEFIVQKLKEVLRIFEAYEEAAKKLFEKSSKIIDWQEDLFILLNNPSKSKDDIKFWLEKILAGDVFSLNQMFLQFNHSINEIAKDLGKKVELCALEQNLWLPDYHKSVLFEFFTHAIRNALDHGLEKPEERQKQGKNQIGRIYLKVQALQGKLKIAVEDDGKGVDLDKVYQIAKSKGLVQFEKHEMSSDQIHGLLFEKGFSTKESISEISGRGVGLDAVLAAAKHQGGSCGISSVWEKGSFFWIELPA